MDAKVATTEWAETRTHEAPQRVCRRCLDGAHGAGSGHASRLSEPGPFATFEEARRMFWAIVLVAVVVVSIVLIPVALRHMGWL